MKLRLMTTKRATLAPKSLAAWFGRAAATTTNAARPPTMLSDKRQAASARIRRQFSHSIATTGELMASAPYALRTPSPCAPLLHSLRRLASAAGAGQKDLLERSVARVHDLASEREQRVMELFERSAVHDAPGAATAFHCERADEDGRLLEVLHKPHAAALVSAPHLVERAAQRHAAVVDQRHVIRHPLHLFEQVRREDHGASVVSHGADDGIEDVAAHNDVEAGRRLVQNQQLGTMGDGGHQASLGTHALRELLDLLGRVQRERVDQLTRVRHVP